MHYDLWSADRPPPKAPTLVSRLSRHYRHLALWVLQGWLAMFYIGAGYAKLTEPLDRLALLMTWPSAVGPALVRAAGWVEIGLAIGLLAPLLSWRLRPMLFVSAAGLMLDAAFMTGYHAAQGDGFIAGVNGLLFAMTIAVLLGRRVSRLSAVRA